LNNKIMRMVLAAALALVLALALAACGEDEVSVDEAIDKAVEQAEEQLGTGEEIDACELLTQKDANDLFRKEATKGTPNTPMVLGECVWEWDSETSNQSVILMVQAGELFYVDDPALESVDIGDRGNIEVNEAAEMIFIQWVQDGNTYSLNYFSIGDDMPEITSMRSDVEALAEEISGRI